MVVTSAIYSIVQQVFAGAALLIATLTDLKTREVPDYLNFALLAFGLGFAALFSVVSWSFLPFLSSLFGFLLCFFIASILFYSGQWGGGDAKLLIALGAVFGIPLSFPLRELIASWSSSHGQTPFLFLFLFFSLLAGGLHGFGWLVFKLWKEGHILFPRMKSYLSTPALRRVRLLLYILFVLFLVLFFFIEVPLGRTVLVLLYLFAWSLLYLPIVVRVVEEHCMIKMVPPAKLTEGDWIASDVVVRGKRICGSKDLGVSLLQIEQLKKLKVKHVPVKEGLPFVPALFVGFLCAVAVKWVLS